jgi:hypothetical protein
MKNPLSVAWFLVIVFPNLLHAAPLCTWHVATSGRDASAAVRPAVPAPQSRTLTPTSFLPETRYAWPRAPIRALSRRARMELFHNEFASFLILANGEQYWLAIRRATAALRGHHWEGTLTSWDST